MFNMKRFVKGLVYGKSAIDNRINFELWEDREYNPCINYPGKLNKELGATPLEKKGCITTNRVVSNKTIVFQRHAFSCANLSKKKGLYNSATEDEKDPSLNVFGILSILSLNRTSTTEPPVFQGKVFVSSLIRTWQTAILEFAPLTNKLELIISPFIIEGGSGKSNTPLDTKGQLFKMNNFMRLLTEMLDLTVIQAERDKLIKIIACEILIQKEGQEVCRYKNGKEETYLPRFGNDEIDPSESIKAKTAFFTSERNPHRPYRGTRTFSSEPVTHSGGAINMPHYEFEYNPETSTSTFNAEIRELPDKFSYTTYFGELGFGYFYQWIHQFPFETIFVVGHGEFMRSVIRAYANFEERETKSYFDENAWRFTIYPNHVVRLSHGIRKPQDTSRMVGEPLCYYTPTSTDTDRIALRKDPYYGLKPTVRYQLPPPEIRDETSSSVYSQSSTSSERSSVSSLARNSSVSSVSSLTSNSSVSSVNSLASDATPLFRHGKPSESSLAGDRNEPRDVSEPIPVASDRNEPIPVAAPSKLLCNSHSSAEFISMANKYSDHIFSYAKKVEEIIDTDTDEKTRIDEIYRVTDDFMRAHEDLFENHFFCSILLHLPYFKHNKDTYLMKSGGLVESFLKKNGHDSAVVITVANTLYQLGHLKSFQRLLIDRCIKNANSTYLHGIVPGMRTCHTLLDTLIDVAIKFSFNPGDTPIEGYSPFMDYLKNLKELIKRGAMFSVDNKLQMNNDNQSYFKRFVLDKLNANSFYRGRLGKDFLSIIGGPFGGTRRLKGTSSSKTSLRRPLVKRATRRGLPYKGRRRSRVNRR